MVEIRALKQQARRGNGPDVATVGTGDGKDVVGTVNEDGLHVVGEAVSGQFHDGLLAGPKSGEG